jgi:hypothetical protein
MSIRTIETTVTFLHPFTLSSIDGLQPAGTYRLGTDEEQTEGLSFVVFQRLTTVLYLSANPGQGQMGEVVRVDPAELAAALEADACS